jgi:hypothetical protein
MARDPNFGAAGKKGYMGGRYSRKAQNLTKAQLGKAGAKAAAKRTVNISQTRREDGKTLGPGGKPLTGTVRMGNGNVAVYKNGKRVISQAVKKVKPSAPISVSSRGDEKPAPPKPDKKRDLVHTRKARDTAMANRPRQTAASSSSAAAAPKSSGATGTYTRSYGRSSRGQMTVAAYLSSQTQRAREKRRASRMTKKK